MGQTAGLYIHIPFCRKKCAYCDFYSLPEQAAAAWDAYVKALTKHIRETAGTLFPDGEPPVTRGRLAAEIINRAAFPQMWYDEKEILTRYAARL